MQLSKMEKAAYDLALPVAQDNGYTIYDVRYEKEGPYWFLRVFLDRDEGVSLDDCEVVSRRLSDLLDTCALFKDNYFLEVSSPGIERLLRQDEHFQWAIGQKVRLKLFKAVEGKKEFEGILESYADGTLTVDGHEFSLKEISKANIAFDF